MKLTPPWATFCCSAKPFNALAAPVPSLASSSKALRLLLIELFCSATSRACASYAVLSTSAPLSRYALCFAAKSLSLSGLLLISLCIASKILPGSVVPPCTTDVVSPLIRASCGAFTSSKLILSPRASLSCISPFSLTSCACI